MKKEEDIMFKQENNGLTYSFDNEKVLIVPWGENSLRVRVTHNHEFKDTDWALIPQEEIKAEIKIHEEIGSPPDGLGSMYD